MSIRLRLTCIGLSALLAGPAAIAEELAEQNEESQITEEVVVVANPLGSSLAVKTVAIVDTEELFRQTESSIGSAIDHLPGMRNASFGEAVGRPVIRGLAGGRVLMLEDELDTLDASSTTVDHIVTLESIVAKQVEVLKGPFSLVYGSGAIGGVVDTVTNRVPRDFNRGTDLVTEARYADNGSRNSLAATLDVSGESIAWHLDAFSRSADNYEIPGEAESEYFHEAEGGDETETDDHDEHEEEGLGETQFDTKGFSLGTSFQLDNGYIGASFSYSTAEYGLPGHVHHHHDEDEHHDEEEHHDEDEEHHDEDEEEHHDEEEEEFPGYPVLDMEQSRVTLVLNREIEGFAGLDELTIRSRISDYEHAEIEEPGHTGTNWNIEGHDSSLILRGMGDGDNARAVGLHFKGGEFSVVGEEAFVPTVSMNMLGVFAMAERPFGDGTLDWGVRLGRDSYSPEVGSDESFMTWSLSLGASIPLSDDGSMTLGVQGDLAARAPSKEELYSNGPHVATRRFDIGDPNLDNEGAQSVSASLAGRLSENFEFESSVYHFAFRDYISLLPTGEEEDELPVWHYHQADGSYTGFEISGALTVVDTSSHYVRVTSQFDTLDGTFGDNDVPLPLVPPSRFTIGVETTILDWEFNLNWVSVMDQEDTSYGELPTDGYQDISLWFAKPFQIGDDSVLKLFAKGTNLTDEEQRLHTSFLKDLAPAPGRTFEVGFRLDM